MQPPCAEHKRVPHSNSIVPSDGVYDAFSNAGFFIVRKGDKLVAYSAICTHKRCKLLAQPDHSFYCKCHGSNFSPEGKVLNGPSKRDLPAYPVAVNEQGQLMVTVQGK